MKRLRSALTTAAATALLTVCGMALAAPAHAEADVNALDGLVTAHANRVVTAGVAGRTLVDLPNLLDPAV